MDSAALTRTDILTYAKERFGADPDYPWERTPDCAVLRHKENRKWYALIMKVGRARLGLPGEGGIEILNLKCDPVLIGALRARPGFLPAYHMNKERWITLRLDGTVSREEGLQLLEMSFASTQGTWKRAPKQNR